MFAPTGAAVGRGYAAGGFIGGGDGEVMAMFQTSDVAERYLVRPGAERPIAAAAAEPWWAGAFESAAMGHDASSIEAQLVALQQATVDTGGYLPADVIRPLLTTEVASAHHHLESSIFTRQKRGGVGVLAGCSLGDDGPIVAFHGRASGELMATLFIPDEDVLGGSEVVVRVGSSAVDEVRSCMYSGGRAAVCARTAAEVTVYEASRDGATITMTTHQTHRCDDATHELPSDDSFAAVALSPIIEFECAAVCDNGNLVCLAPGDREVQALRYPFVETGQSVVPVGCEYGHHPRQVVVATRSAVTLCDFRAPSDACRRLSWDVRLSGKELLSVATDRQSTFQYVTSATSGQLFMLDERMPGDAVLEWAPASPELPAYVVPSPPNTAKSTKICDMLFTCSVAHGEIHSYATTSTVDPVELQLNTEASPAWIDVARGDLTTVRALGLPQRLGSAWDASTKCPVLHRQRLRTPTTGFDVIKLACNVQESTESQYVLLRSTAAGDIFGRTVTVGDGSVTSGSESDSSLSPIWARWSDQIATFARSRNVSIGFDASLELSRVLKGARTSLVSIPTEPDGNDVAEEVYTQPSTQPLQDSEISESDDPLLAMGLDVFWNDVVREARSTDPNALETPMRRRSTAPPTIRTTPAVASATGGRSSAKRTKERHGAKRRRTQGF